MYYQKYLLFFIIVLLFSACKKEEETPPHYEDLNTGKVYSSEEIRNFIPKELLDMSSQFNTEDYLDSIKDRIQIRFHLKEKKQKGDSLIQSFDYDLMLDNEYIVRSKKYDKIGMSVPARTFTTINGNEIQIGGEQAKPTLLNLWFIRCPGCIAEMPALNHLYEKYADKVNFVAMTFESKKAVNKFLLKKEFKFSQIAEIEDEYLNYIGTYPYPENIFFDKNGCIRYIEGPLPSSENLNHTVKFFESLLDKLLEEHPEN